MPFTSLANRISDLPLILVGPILRKVTDNSVSVFIVTKNQQQVTLKVFDSSDSLLLSQSTTTKKLGEHVHALVVTASGNANTLYPNHVFHYNLEFSGTEMISTSGEFADGILVNANYSLPFKLGYASHNFPTFVLPPHNKNHIKFAHGSCRKPHGGVTDALRGLDTMLSSSITDLRGVPQTTPDATQIEEINQRPHLLCLTGDQIYADDVADSLLHMLIDAEEHLYKWGNPHSRESIPEAPSNEDLKPGKRHSLIAGEKNTVAHNKISFGKNEAKSHLIRLAEYYSMYMLAWSDVLWPTQKEDFPSFENVIGEPKTTIIKNPVILNSGNEIEAAGITTREHKKYKKFKIEDRKIKEYYRTLKFVRRALANIPCYMMFDDHEITDDWFLTKLWVENSLNPDTLVKRMIQNGLSAFAVFQAWGNTPEKFTAGKGAQLLSSLESLNTRGGTHTDTFNTIGDLLLPKLSTDGKKLVKRHEDNIDWHFQVAFHQFNLIVLDTRTQRSYADSETPPGLINIPQIEKQISNTNNKDLAIIISPAPVFGNIAIEDIQILTTLYYYRNPYSKDYESWVFDQPSFQALLDRISVYPSSILLSGDVHYGFSASIQYWNNRSGTVKSSGIAQLCSSSLKNSDANTEKASYSKALGLKLRPKDIEFLGWKTGGAHLSVDQFIGSLNEEVVIPVAVPGNPAIHEIDDPVKELIKTPDWRYRIFFETDSRKGDQRISDAPLPLNSSNDQAAAGYKHYNKFRWFSHRYVVGRDNICLVKLKDEGKKLDHEFWFVMGDRDAADDFVPQSSTLHEVVCGKPNESVKLPGN